MDSLSTYPPGELLARLAILSQTFTDGFAEDFPAILTYSQRVLVYTSVSYYILAVSKLAFNDASARSILIDGMGLPDLFELGSHDPGIGNGLALFLKAVPFDNCPI